MKKDQQGSVIRLHLHSSEMVQSESIAYLSSSKGGHDFLIITRSSPCDSNAKLSPGPCVPSSRSSGRNIILCDESLWNPSLLASHVFLAMPLYVGAISLLTFIKMQDPDTAEHPHPQTLPAEAAVSFVL